MTITNPAAAPSVSAWIGAMRPRTLDHGARRRFSSARRWPGGRRQGRNLLPRWSPCCRAACIQIATNLFNDAKDFERGGDGPDRLGPCAPPPAGCSRLDAIKRAAVGHFRLGRAGLDSIWSLSAAGPSCCSGSSSIASGWAYTGGTAADLLLAVRRDFRHRLFRARRGVRDLLALRGRAVARPRARRLRGRAASRRAC